MHYRFSLLAALLAALAVAGCTKSEDDVRKAQRATNDLMPDNDPKFEAEWVADQSQVKLVAARTVSYEPLDSFRGKSKSRTSEEAPSDEEQPKAKPKAKPSGIAGPARGASQTGAPSGGPGFWTRVGMKALIGGGPAASPPKKPASKDKEPAAKEDKSDEDKDSGDEEKSEDDDSGDKESKDSDSDGN